MKKTLFIATVFSLFALGCKKETKDSSTTGTSLKTFYLKLDGTAKNVTSIASQHTNGWILTSGSTTPGESISLRIDDTVQTGGSYAFSNNGPFRLFYTPDNYVNSYVSASGTALVTSYDTLAKKIKGTYNCILVGNQTPADTIVVTDGEFNIQYP